MKPITCLEIWILCNERQGGTMPGALREFATWPAMRQHSFTQVLKQAINNTGLLWMEGRKVTDPETLHEFTMRAKPIRPAAEH